MTMNFSPSFTRRKFLATALLMSGAALSPGIAGATTAPEKYVQGIAKDVLALANSGVRGSSLQSRFVSLLQRHSDIRSIAMFSLGNYQKELPSALRSRFYDLVVRYTAGLFAYYIEDFAGSGFDIKSSKPQGKAIIVDSAIRYEGGTSSPVKWRVVSFGSGFRVNDVNVRGIWLSLQMRDKFTSVLKQNKGDFEALLDYLRKNT
jgi:phospholipid transport system substrate-binding protein